MSHVYLARDVLPSMLARKEGYLVGTVSAAGLLNHMFAAPYGVTKSAALSFFEWLAIAHGDDGIRVSCLCPQGVKTDMLETERRQLKTDFLTAGALEPAVRKSVRSEEHTSELQSRPHLVCRLLLEKKKNTYPPIQRHSTCTSTTTPVTRQRYP